MRICQKTYLPVVAAVLCLLGQPVAPGADSSFVTLFNGHSLSGWSAIPIESASDWSITKGVIRGMGSVKRQSYLVYEDNLLEDFELTFSYRLPAKGNTGVSIRMRVDTTGKRAFESYHADVGHSGIGPHILGAWDFHFANRKEHSCKRGTSLLIRPDGSVKTTLISDGLKQEDIRIHQWNDVHVIARGNHLQFYINGSLSSELRDQHPAYFRKGSIALQIHDLGMVVEFKDILLKKL
jgi:hypothetical protein